jgi:hypothetical protein
MNDVPSAVPAHRCENCGGLGTWHPARLALVCPSCGTVVVLPPESWGPVLGFPLLPSLRDRPDSGRDWRPQATHLLCRSCHSVVRYSGHVVGRNCDACGAPALMPCDGSGAPVVPEGVLPFRITLDAARQAVTEWLGSHRMLRRRGVAVIDTAETLYLPYWAFTARVQCRWRGEVQRTNRQGETRRIGIDGEVDRAFDDYLEPASGSALATLLRSVEPFPMADVRPYDERYLAGSTVETYNINMWDGWDRASARMHQQLNDELERDSKCSPDALETWPKWSGEQCTHLLVPAYVITYQHRGQRYQTVVNGWTARVAGTAPRDVLVEILSGVILLTVALGLIYAAFRVIRGLV